MMDRRLTPLHALRRVLPFLAGLCLLTLPALSQEPEDTVPAPVLWEALQARDFATDVDWEKAVQAFVGHGENAIAVLTSALPVARDDEELVDITYFTALILSQGRIPGGSPASLPREMITQLDALFERSDDLRLQANLANIAAMLGPDAAPMIDGLIALLRSTSDPGLRATTQFALGAVGEEALPVLYDELRNGKDERLLGDIAQILRGRVLPDDIVSVIEGLLEANDTEVREQAINTLRDMGIDSRRLSQAAAANLAAAETDQQRMMATAKLAALDGPPDLVVPALGDALNRFDETRSSSERIQVARYLALTGSTGITALARATGAARSQEERSDLVFALSMSATDDPAVIEALIVSAFHSDNEDTRQSAMGGLIRVGEPAVPAIEEAMDKWSDPDLRRHLDVALTIIHADGSGSAPNGP